MRIWRIQQGASLAPDESTASLAASSSGSQSEQGPAAHGCLVRIRKSRGLTEVELAEQMGLIQSLISDYENDKLRPHGEMVARFALALEISADELLGVKPAKAHGKKPSRKVLRRLERIESLPPHQQSTLLKTTDTFLRGAGAP